MPSSKWPAGAAMPPCLRSVGPCKTDIYISWCQPPLDPSALAPLERKAAAVPLVLLSYLTDKTSACAGPSIPMSDKAGAGDVGH